MEREAEEIPVTSYRSQDTFPSSITVEHRSLLAVDWLKRLMIKH